MDPNGSASLAVISSLICPSFDGIVQHNTTHFSIFEKNMSTCQCEKVGYRYGTCVVTIILVKVRTYREEWKVEYGTVLEATTVRWNTIQY
jgi:hypothetical protein